MPRKHNEHFTAAYVAQEARKNGRAGDFDFVMSDGAGRFTSAAVVAIDEHRIDPRCAPQLSIFDAREFKFRLPQPISVNELYGVNLNTGQKYLTEKQKQFRSQVIAIVHREMRLAEQRDKPLAGRIFATVLVSDRLDIDNGLKSLFDGLQHAKAMANDAQVARLLVEKVPMPRDREFCDVVLKEIGA